MKIPQLEAELEFDEGFRGKPYQDSVGVWTVGFGHNLEANPLTRDQALYLMRTNLIACIKDLESFPFWKLSNEARRHAFVNMRYQLGLGGFREFRRMIAAANSGDWAAAAEEARDSVWFEQTPNRVFGLRNRRDAV